MRPAFGRVTLRPLDELTDTDWRRLQSHFRDPEIAYLNGTPPNRMPLWLLKRLLKTDTRRPDRATFGIFDERGDFIGTTELYDVRGDVATLGIIIGERTHWSAGYGPEAMHALLAYAFDALGLEVVRLETFGDNLRAQRAFRKVGFQEVDRRVDANGRIDVRMELLRERWRQLRSESAPSASGPDLAERSA
ncbi:MAG: GNAT family N-acetyltransferase [Deinococcales bacterium]|nr:GNAT family N-acetyltransferase [Deinococcales bacterium]